MIELGCACDGGKDSLSMAAAAGGESVMAPGNLVVSAYVGCPDVTKVGGLQGLRDLINSGLDRCKARIREYRFLWVQDAAGVV